MIHDSEGFLSPSVDEERCVKCGMCSKVCTSLNRAVSHSNMKALVYRSLVPESEGSSSGGAAYTLGRAMVERGGVVIACAFDHDGNAHHITVSSLDDLSSIQGSKYVQSDARDGYKKCLQHLQRGTQVLFIGTPCQVAAVKRLCGECSSLITCDLICHGTPSPLFWQRNLDYQNSLGYLEPRKDVQFRTHSKRSRVCFALHCAQCNAKQIPYEFDPYYSLFIRNASLRESCYSCPFARAERVGDITIGDCASVDSYLGFHDEMPVSTLCANTDTGVSFIDETVEAYACDYTKLNYGKEVKLNKQLHEPSKRPLIRDYVYRDLANLDYAEFARKYVSTPGPAWWFRRVAKALVPIRVRVEIKRFMGFFVHD